MTEPSSSSRSSEIPFAAPPAVPSTLPSTPSNRDPDKERETVAAKKTSGDLDGTSTSRIEGEGGEDDPSPRRPRQGAAASIAPGEESSTTHPAINQGPSISSGSNTNTKRPRLEYLGPVQSFPELEQARLDLNQRVQWFRDHPISSDHPIQFLDSTPTNNNNNTHLEGDDDEHSVDEKTSLAVPFWKTDPHTGRKKKFGRKTVPKCLFLECHTQHEQILLLNWWRSHTHDEQVQIQSYDQHHGLKRYYRAPNRSASPFQYAVQRYSGGGGGGGTDKNGTAVLDLVKEQERKVDREMRMESARALKLELGLVVEQRTQDDFIPTNTNTTTMEEGSGVPEALEKTETPSPTPRKYYKRTKRPLVAPNVMNAPLGFRAMQSTMDLMKRFDLSVDKLYCAEVVVLSTNNNHNNTTRCRLETCPYPALMNNFQFCALHKQNWWAREGAGLTNRGRGHLLLGPQYANRRTVDHIVASEGTYKRDPGACSCVGPLCHAIGWSAEMVRVPKDVALPETIRLGEKKVVKGRLVATRLAPWHFPPTSRMQLPDGSWKPLFGQKADKFVMPTYDITQFLKEPGMVEYQERKSMWLLPDWVYEMQAVEEGPMTLAELQRLDFRKQQKNLIRKAEMDAIVHQTLFQAHSEVTDKMDEIKKTYKKRRKPVEKSGKKKRKVVKAADSESLAGYPEDDDSDEESDRGHGGGNNEPTATSTQVAEAQPPGLLSNLPYAQGGAAGLLNHPHSALTHQQAHHLQAAFGVVHNPLLGDTTRLEDAANRAWGQYYTNSSLGRPF